MHNEQEISMPDDITFDDIVSGGNAWVKMHKPQTLDMDRLMDIVLSMKALAAEVQDPDEFEAQWKARIKQIIDFDTLAYQAMQVGFQLHNIENHGDLVRLRLSGAWPSFVKVIQAFYDGFLIGAEFQQKGGHRA